MDGRRASTLAPLNDKQCLVILVQLILVVAPQAEGFYFYPPARCAGASRPNQRVSSMATMAARSRDFSFVRALDRVNTNAPDPFALRSTDTGTTYAEYMALRREKESKSGDTTPTSSSSVSVEETPAESAPSIVMKEAAVPAANVPEAVTVDTAATAETPVGSTMEETAPPPGKEFDEAGEAEKEVNGGIEVVEVSETRTEQLSKRVGEEVSMATSRAQRMADLSSELERSFAKKEEVERVIASEIAQLSQKLQQERDIEIAREVDLRGLLKEFGEAIFEKQDLIEKEQDLLAQMQALREQVEEPSIKAPIEAAMAKKADVTSIEVMLLEDLVECRDKLEEELRSTSARADTMNGVVAALPSEESDAVRMRAYNWQDVQDLQEVLLSSVESMEASDAQVSSLRAKLLDAVKQKRQVLGEVSSSTQIVKDGADETAKAKKMSMSRTLEVSKELTEDELLRLAAQSSTSAAVGVAKSVAAGVTSLSSYAKSPEAQDVAASTVDVVSAISGAASAIGDAFREAKREFNEKSMSPEELTSFDKIFVSLRDGVKAFTGSAAVKAKLEEAGGLVSKQLPEAGGRVGKGAIEAFKGAATNEDIGNPVREALDSVEKFIVSMAALGAKQFSNPKAAYFQLPGGGPPKKKEASEATVEEDAPSSRLEGTSAPADTGTQGETSPVAEGVAREEVVSPVGDTGVVVDAEPASS